MKKKQQSSTFVAMEEDFLQIVLLLTSSDPWFCSSLTFLWRNYTWNNLHQCQRENCSNCFDIFVSAKFVGAVSWLWRSKDHKESFLSQYGAHGENSPWAPSICWEEQALLLFQVRPPRLYDEKEDLLSSSSLWALTNRFHLQKWPQLENHGSSRVGLKGQAINHACTENQQLYLQSRVCKMY